MLPEYAIRAKALAIADLLQDTGLKLSQGLEALDRAREICRIVLIDDTATKDGGFVAN